MKTFVVSLLMTSQADAGWTEAVLIDTTDYHMYHAITARNDSVYVIHGFNKFVRSLDAGATWQDHFVLPEHSLFENEFKLKGDTLVLFFWDSDLNAIRFYFSTDFGDNWQGPRGYGQNSGGWAFSASYTSSLVSVCSRVPFDDDDMGVILKHSPDFGRTWTEPETVWTYDRWVWPMLYFFYGQPYVLSRAYDGGMDYATIRLLLRTGDSETWISYDSLTGVGPNWGQTMDASGSGQMAFVYHEWNTWIDYDSKVFVCLSSDSGLSWSPPIDLSAGDVNHYPSVAVSADTVVVAWGALPDSSATYGSILLRKTYDLGQTWESLEELPDSAFHPQIVIDGQKIHLIYLRYLGREFAIYYRRWEPETGIEEETNKPQQISMTCYPNPFNSSTTFTYTLSEDMPVTLSIYNLLGQQVATLFEGLQQAGQHSLTWDASDLPSGIYFARLETSGRSTTIKMVLLK